MSDYVYGYGPALSDGVVRPVIFLAYSGEMRWRTRAGDEITGTLGTPMLPDQLAQAWRTALDPEGEWVQRVLEAADRRLTEVRRGMPDAAGLVIASDHEDARAYAALLRRMTGQRPVVVLSDDPAASRKIAAFAESGDRWMVAVRMVSEGVDIPRLAVGVYATSVGTALFFAQAVGRFVRARQRGETASVFLPSIPALLGYAAELEAERDHVLPAPPTTRRSASSPRRSASRDTPDSSTGRCRSRRCRRPRTSTGCSTTAAEFGTTAAEEDFLGLPGLLEPEQVALLLRKRQADQLPRQRAGRAARRGRPARPGPLRPGPPRRAGHPGEPGRAAQGTERPDRRVAPPHRPAARGGARRPAPGLRRPAAAAGHRGADPGPHRDDPPLGGPGR